MTKRLRGWFVTGTDTGVGKTHVTVGLLRALRRAGHSVSGYKPVCSGAILDSSGTPVWNDIQQLTEASGSSVDSQICPQRFLAPLAPPLAALAEHRSVNEELLVSGAYAWQDQVDWLIVEGAGGLFTPVSDRWTNADLAARLGFPLIIIAAQRLGVINHALLTIAAARTYSLPIAGVVLNQVTSEVDVSTAHNAREIERHSGVPVLGNLRFATADREFDDLAKLLH